MVYVKMTYTDNVTGATNTARGIREADTEETAALFITIPSLTLKTIESEED